MENEGNESVGLPATLADRVTDVLLEKIRGGEFAAGDRLPSEAALAQRFNVSRTVIREAVSRLKAEGLVATHQGKGTLIVGAGQSARFQIDVNVDGVVSAVLRVMELRSGLEAEVAALAAERRTATQNAEIQRALRAIDEAVADGRNGVDEDLAFHNAIANATGNPLYTSLLCFLRQFLREAVTLGRMSEPRFGDVEAQLRDEHHAVAEAIARQDVEGARAAARHHIANVAARIRGADVDLWSEASREVARKLAKSEENVLSQVGGK
ncbi:MAG: GntR family transcriptional regulator, transcriptional repressor for pyruvate dehydrogenase complex [Massilia sp.]|jgi:DNA-binding FadR family transcriptional regulator